MVKLVEWDAANSRYKEVEVVTVPEGTSDDDQRVLEWDVVGEEWIVGKRIYTSATEITPTVDGDIWFDTSAAALVASQRLDWLVKYGRTVIITDIGL